MKTIIPDPCSAMYVYQKMPSLDNRAGKSTVSFRLRSNRPSKPIVTLNHSSTKTHTLRTFSSRNVSSMCLQLGLKLVQRHSINNRYGGASRYRYHGNGSPNSDRQGSRTDSTSVRKWRGSDGRCRQRRNGGRCRWRNRGCWGGSCAPPLSKIAEHAVLAAINRIRTAVSSLQYTHARTCIRP